MSESGTPSGETMRLASRDGRTFPSGGGPRTHDSEPDIAVPRDAQDLAEIVRAAHQDRVALRIVGGGTWLAAGRPVAAHRHVHLSGLAGVVDYTPGDLTITARAGTTLATLHEVTHAQHQWLPLDPVSDPRGTLGATLASASSGPLASSAGLPRDLALGVEFVSGTGEILRGGGRVVKNVAGFDLVRLQVGAWGTLGVLTEATLRLRAIPEADETRALGVPTDRAQLERLLTRIRTIAGGVVAAELVNATFATSIGLEPRPQLLVRLTGNHAAVRTQMAELTGETSSPLPTSIWAHVTEPLRDVGVTTLRWSAPPTELGALWTHAMRVLPEPVSARATVTRGVLRLSGGDEILSSPPTGARRVIERTTPAHWTGAPASAHDRLSVGMRAAFDPAGILNPGIFGA